MDNRSTPLESQNPIEKTGPRSYRHWAFNLLFIVAVFFAVRTCNQNTVAEGPAKSFEGKTVDGRTISLSDYRGKPVLLHFWATWCGACNAMEGNIKDVAHDYPVLTVASQSGDAEQVRATVVGHELSFPVVLDPDGRIARTYGVSAFPTTFFIDKKGEIRHVEVGYTTEPGLRLRMRLTGR
jgi:peroxiredoxin